jgi:LPXTG-site transpeptidase (sortase) family protein
MNRLASWLGIGMLIVGLGIATGLAVSHFETSAPSKGPAASTKGPGSTAIDVKNPITTSETRTVETNRDPIRIRIPSIGVDAPVVETRVVTDPNTGLPTWQVADWAVGHLAGTSLPGSVGNMALSAHDDIDGELFQHIGTLAHNAKIFVFTKKDGFVYEVKKIYTAGSNQGEQVLASRPGQRRLTLISCTPYWIDTARVIVSAKLEKGYALTHSIVE